MKFTRVCVAGTFGKMHAGHEALLTRAFFVGQKVLVGLTSDVYIKNFKKNHESRIMNHDSLFIIQPYAVRKKKLLHWLTERGYIKRAMIVPIDDPFEPAASDPNLEALIVSEETKDNGELLNEKRVGRGLPKLELIVLPVLPGFGKLVMPEHLRRELAKPLGAMLSSHARPGLSWLMITVGDVTTKNFLDAGITPRLMIIDNKVNRKPFFGGDVSAFQKTNLVSGPGYIAGNSNSVIRRLLVKNTPQVLVVTGEEDLLVLPAVIEAKVGSFVYYGQPGVGLIEVAVTKQKKKEVQMLLDQFL